MRGRGLIVAAALFLAGEVRVVGRVRPCPRATGARHCLSSPCARPASIIEEILHEFGPPPRRRAGAAALLAVVANPFAGGYAAELQPAMEDLKPLGLMMAERLIAALGGPEGIDGYGKGAIVGEAGEVEHGALWHVPGGYAMRELLGDVAARSCPRR